ncbi:DUF190 domain-containing protein [bacterium]|nr:DUF190 domain-containing protein [bacterium]
MVLEGEGKLLRIFIGETDKLGNLPLYEAILKAARNEGMAGGTVLRGIAGFGANSLYIHTAKILRLSEDMPIVIEFVDSVEKVDAFVKRVGELIESAQCGALVTEEKAHVIQYRKSDKKS